MPPADEYADLGGGAYRWEAYDRESKVDLSASALITPEGLLFIDPIPLREEALAELQAAAGVPVAGIFLTNANHERAAAWFSRRLGTPVFSRAAPPPGRTVIPLPGGAPGEAALHCGDALVVGDALINLATHPFSLLPAKYCEDPAELRRSLRRLLDLRFERLLFAHGEPIMAGARDRVAALLGRSGRSGGGGGGR